MPQNTHLEIIGNDPQFLPELGGEASNIQILRAKAERLAAGLTCLPDIVSSHTFGNRLKAAAAGVKHLTTALQGLPATSDSDDARWLNDNVRLFHKEIQATAEGLKTLKKIEHVRTRKGEILPRVLALAEGFLETVSYRFDEQKFSFFVGVFQQSSVLQLREFWALATALELVLLEQIVVRGCRFVSAERSEPCGIGICIRSLRDIANATSNTTWKESLEPLILFDQVLREDPAAAYAQMDFDSRDLYRHKLAAIAKHSDLSEMEVAHAALDLAERYRQTQSHSREAVRKSHIGYYLLDQGVSQLHAKVGFKYSLVRKLQATLRKYPDRWFLPGVAILTFAIAYAIVLLIPGSVSSFTLALLSFLALLLPASHSALWLMNHLVTSLLSPEILPKLDFSERIPADCMTMVAIPSLLLGQEQVRGLVEDLEIRFLGNQDRNLHFALLTDLPDSSKPAKEDSPLVDLCAKLIRELNEKYAGQGAGSFFLFHRHRVYDPRERAWMGWERKRGKLLDLNRLLRGQSDAFPVKVGDLRICSHFRYVITLDSDTELPRGSAHRMVGALAHPLNSAIVDPKKNIVTAGYGILQPRVGVSVKSTARSRLAAIYAGETGFDIYTKAVSDLYQDLYKEGTYTGKGIYEVETLHRILDRRFPRNSLLSHDLIEGAYARAGLLSDIEVIEDYPSHYSAYNRRKHRWLRGDWQIVEWLFPRVRNEAGTSVPNPISLISRWKILDNLRRSLVEPATLLLLVLGWFVLGGEPLRWTIATLCVLFIPAWCQFALKVLRAIVAWNIVAVREGFTELYSTSANLFFTVTFLPHQTLLSLDAVIRASVRRFVTHRRLLEWETAAETEMGQRGPTPIDRYLHWMPGVAFGIAFLVWMAKPHALVAALPLLLLWGSSEYVSAWLNRPSVAPPKKPSRDDLSLLRRAAFYTWRYFSEFSTEEHNWLIPDNVQEDPPLIAARISPTNLGLLLNARQAACEFGYLTVPELAEQTLRTLATVAGLRKYCGHLFNWYDTRTLQPLVPLFVSSVDSGNLLASLWTLQQGCTEQLRKPLLQSCLLDGFVDCLRALEELGGLPPGQFDAFDTKLKLTTDAWLNRLITLPETVFNDAQRIAYNSSDPRTTQWILAQACSRVQAIKQTVHDYAPWLLPEFSALRNDPAIDLNLGEKVALELVPDFVDELGNRLDRQIRSAVSSERQVLCERLRWRLPEARRNVTRLVKDLQIISTEAGRLADEMDFTFLLDHRRKLMSIGFDAGRRQLSAACYDLLGTESRTAVFVAVAKGDIPQQSWFLLGRAHTLDGGRPVLLSWTGTLFEYLMPTLWMRSYSKTLLERSRVAAVRSQRAYAASKGLPWGISESAHIQRDEAGNYQYHAFGLPHLALRKPEVDALVVSPYSTFLALATDPSEALRNLRRMREMGWLGSYGFYEAADYGPVRTRFRQHRYQLVRCWMAHHQGMSLLALLNFLKGNIVQNWFHNDRRVQATEMLLQEKPVAHVQRRDLAPRVSTA